MLIDRRRFIHLSGGVAISAMLRSNEKYIPERVIVVGAGIMGTSIAYHLAQRGAQVVVCEKLRPGSGATEKSFAWINASFEKQPKPYYLLNLLGISAWRRLQHELKDQLQIQWGGSVIWSPPGSDSEKLRQNIRSHQAWGYATHLVDSEKFKQLLPNVTPGPIGAACWSENEGTVSPTRALAVLLQAAERLSVKFLYPCEVTSFEFTSGRVRAVQTNRGRFPADVVVLAAGVNTMELAGKLGVRVPLKDSPGVLVHTPAVHPLLQHIALGPSAHIKQNPDGEIVMGTTFGASPVTDASTGLDYAPHIVKEVTQFVPRLKHTPVDRVTMGMRVMPLDEFPIVGFAPGQSNLYIAAMHSGMTLSPLIGQLAALEILEKADVDLLQPYRCSRFSSPV
jgi:glycine/D-amino acid oxidase-like deaminating enzyme